MNLVVKYLFIHIIQLINKTNFKRIFAATIARYYYSFLEANENEPPGTYKYPDHHPFHHKIIFVIAETQISLDTFLKWQDEVIESFNKNSWLEVEVSKVGLYSSKRCVGSHFVDMVCY